MKTISKFGVALLAVALALSCKKASENAEASRSASPTQNLSGQARSSAKNDSGRKFIRTANIKFRVKDVAESTYAIENSVSRLGGFVTNTELRSDILEKDQTRISADSTLQTTKYNVINNMTIRVPNKRLDTVVKLIAKEVEYLDSRTIKADDATLKMLANELAASRNEAYKNRMERAIDKTPRKLNDVSSAENDLLQKQADADNAKVETLAMNDQLNFSTLTLELYQREVVKQELIAHEKSVNAYRPHIGMQLWDSVKTGWFILEAILAFIAKLWSLILLVAIAVFLFRRYGRKAKPIL